jgi:DNA-3-methyladenine glycosylase
MTDFLPSYNNLLPREFYSRDTLTVAKELLGKILSVKSELGEMRGMIVETEAYMTGDPASHGFRGPTRRNAAMFGPPGHAYVYFTYGCHFMLNVVTDDEGVGEAVLIRALEPLTGIELMQANRGNDIRVADHKLCAGPGRLAKALGITREGFDTLDLCSNESSITILDAQGISDSEIAACPRIGIKHAVEMPWRFTIRGNRSLSRK